MRSHVLSRELGGLWNPMASGQLFARGSADGIRSVLSVRQWHVAELAAHGYSNREIAQELKLTEQIVKNVLHSVFDKIGVWNRVELANRFGKDSELRVGVESRSHNGSDRSEQLPCETVETEPAVERVTVDDTGMELRDLCEDADFPFRKKRPRPGPCAADAYQTLGRVFADAPGIVLQRLVDAATSFCGADSAGISLEEMNGEQKQFRWIAISGSFAPFLGGTTPRFFSPCGITLSSGRPQLYRVGSAYYDSLGIKAEPITDGILIPWQASEMRGTLWAVSHRYREAFDVEDFKLLNGLAEFSAMAVENRFRKEAENMQTSGSCQTGIG